ncbi:hypothetical protein [Streptomyces mirabilis]|uniref:hypothetical protein n=1 Tax=Streptomyces mirabilis TaxID=68239 RepID=UPI0036916305
MQDGPDRRHSRISSVPQSVSRQLTAEPRAAEGAQEDQQRAEPHAEGGGGGQADVAGGLGSERHAWREGPSSQVTWPRVPMHITPGIQTPRWATPRRARHQPGSVGGHGLAHGDAPQEYLERGLPTLRSR